MYQDHFKEKANKFVFYWQKSNQLLTDEAYRDQTLSDLAQRKIPFIDTSVVKLLGSNELKAEYFDKIFNTQIERGKLTSEKAAKVRQSIIEGRADLFVQDQIIGNATSWLLEKALTPAVALATINSGYPELTPLALVAYWSTNLTAIPYFIPRAIQEYRHHRTKLKTTESDREKIKKESQKAALELTGAVLLNATPASPFAIPLLSRLRYPGLSGIYLGYHVDNLKDLILKNRGQKNFSDSQSNIS